MESTESLVRDFTYNPLPKGLVLAKPLQREAYKEEVIYQLEKDGKLIKTRKRDGWKLFFVKFGGVWKIYTDGMNEVDGRLDHIKKELNSLRLPDKTVLVGEGIVDLDGNDSRPKVISIFQSNLARSLELQNHLGRIKAMFFEVMFYDGRYLLSDRYASRLAILKRSLGRKKLNYLMLETVLDMSYDDAKKLVRKLGWEGLVLYDSEFTSSFKLGGQSPSRPKGCYKWKPIFEDDFVVRGWLPHRKDPNKFKEVMLLQINPVSKQEFDCGKLGSFNKTVRERLLTTRYPIVMQVQFEGRYESGKLINPVFVEIRTDKKPEDCIAPKSFSVLR